MKKTCSINAVIKATLIVGIFLALAGCGGRYSMNSTALGVECETRADCIKRLGLPGAGSGVPKFTVAPYSVEGQSTKAVVGTPAIGGGSFDADADVIVMQAIRDAYPASALFFGGPLAGAVHIVPTGVNVQSVGLSAKCEMRFTAKYEGASVEYNARGDSGVSWNFGTAMPKACPGMKAEVSKSL